MAMDGEHAYPMLSVLPVLEMRFANAAVGKASAKSANSIIRLMLNTP